MNTGSEVARWDHNTPLFNKRRGSNARVSDVGEGVCVGAWVGTYLEGPLQQLVRAAFWITGLKRDHLPTSNLLTCVLYV